MGTYHLPWLTITLARGLKGQRHLLSERSLTHTNTHTHTFGTVKCVGQSSSLWPRLTVYTTQNRSTLNFTRCAAVTYIRRRNLSRPETAAISTVLTSAVLCLFVTRCWLTLSIREKIERAVLKMPIGGSKQPHTSVWMCVLALADRGKVSLIWEHKGFD